MPNYRIELFNNQIISLRKTRAVTTEDFIQEIDGKILLAIVEACSEDEARNRIETLVKNTVNNRNDLECSKVPSKNQPRPVSVYLRLKLIARTLNRKLSSLLHCKNARLELKHGR
jgi:transcription-repair coupling factor (superfamily II helicase)